MPNNFGISSNKCVRNLRRDGVEFSAQSFHFTLLLNFIPFHRRPVAYEYKFYMKLDNFRNLFCYLIYTETELFV